MPEWAAALILRTMEAVSCTAIVRNLRPAPVAMILSRLPISVAAEHFQSERERAPPGLSANAPCLLFLIAARPA